MRSSRALCASAVVVTLVPAAAAAWRSAGGRDPQRLVLTRSDLPAGAKPVARWSGAGAALAELLVDGRGRALARASRHYQAAYRLPSEDVRSAAFVFESKRTARALFARLARSLPSVYRPVRASTLGDEQVVTYAIADAFEHRFIVRRGDVLWQLDVLDWRVAARERLTSAALALARRQAARI